MSCTDNSNNNKVRNKAMKYLKKKGKPNNSYKLIINKPIINKHNS